MSLRGRENVRWRKRGSYGARSAAPFLLPSDCGAPREVCVWGCRRLQSIKIGAELIVGSATLARPERPSTFRRARYVCVATRGRDVHLIFAAA